MVNSQKNVWYVFVLRYNNESARIFSRLANIIAFIVHSSSSASGCKRIAICLQWANCWLHIVASLNQARTNDVNALAKQ